MVPIPRANPMIPLTEAEKIALCEAMQARRGQMAGGHAWEEVMEGYARLWLHLCAAHQVPPVDVVDMRDARGCGILGAWEEAAGKLAIHPRTFLGTVAKTIGKRALALAEKAKLERSQATAGTQQSLFDLW